MRKVIVSLFVFICLICMADQRVYTNALYCNSSLTLYDSGRADWYDCEVDETFYGHYWQKNDTMFIETLCSSLCHEDHKCISPRLDICTLQNDTLWNVGYQEVNGKSTYYLDSICYYISPHKYIHMK